MLQNHKGHDNFGKIRILATQDVLSQGDTVISLFCEVSSLKVGLFNDILI